VLDRVMSEAARLLRFTDLTVQQVALRVGYDDPLYFSRAFKRHFGDSPVAYRAQSRGRSIAS
jgi:AraC family transcriptional regulator, transcriptional activator of pobA